MIHTVVCYIQGKDKVLMLYRNKKKNDLNGYKWIGVGGKIEPNETPDMAIVREVKEETGFDLLSKTKRGIVRFFYDDFEEIMNVYTSTDFVGDIIECSEGELHWVKKEDVFSLNIWEGDRVFLPLVFSTNENFDITLVYKNNELVKVERTL